MRRHVPSAKKEIIACAVLHNISILWSDVAPPADDDDEPEQQEPEVEQEVPAELDDRETRRRGQDVRNALMHNMAQGRPVPRRR